MSCNTHLKIVFYNVVVYYSVKFVNYLKLKNIYVINNTEVSPVYTIVESCDYKLSTNFNTYYSNLSLSTKSFYFI